MGHSQYRPDATDSQGYFLYPRGDPSPDHWQQMCACFAGYVCLDVRHCPSSSCLSWSELYSISRLLNNTPCSNWILKYILLVFYSKIVVVLWHGKLVIYIVAVIFAISYFTNLILIFVECRPISLYWTIVPDPGSLPIPL
jgi:hypothetical protein